MPVWGLPCFDSRFRYTFPFTQSPPREKRVETKADLASGVVLQTVIYKDLYGMLTVFLKREKKCYVFK